VGTRSYAARSNNCKAAILAANTNERRASSAPPSTPSCLRPTFTRFTYSPKSVAARRFSHQAMNLWSAGGTGAPHRFPQVRKHRESLGAPEGHTRSEKAPSPLRFAGAVQKSVTKKCRRIDSGDNSQTTFLRIPQTLRKK